MAQQLITVRLNRGDAQPWGFRLQGGVDFGTPLALQKVNGGSLADSAGLIAGDALLKVNGVDVYNLRHKDAQDVVVRAGNNVEMTVQRGGQSTWRPAVTPTGALPQAGSGYGGPVTKTSLAAYQQPQPISQPAGNGYNNTSKPFPSDGGDMANPKSIVNKQYNTPVGIYSDESIAETLSAQAEVLAGGVLGVNFKKNEKAYDSTNSEVFKMLQEVQNDPPEPEEPRSYSPRQQQQQQQFVPNQNVNFGPTKHVNSPVAAPVNRANTGGLPTGQNICAECERLIIGVFVRIRDKNLHVDCFRCATCGSSLKNQGYFNINNKLYCDVHAKLIAMKNPPPGTEGYLPVPIKPSSKLSANTISQALSQHHNIHVTGNPNLVSGNNAINQNVSAPKPYNYPTMAPKSPTMAAPKSPSSYPPPGGAPAWSQPAPQQQQNYGSATLPRAHHQPSQPSTGNYNTLRPFKSSPSGGLPNRNAPNAFKKGGAGITVGPKRGRGVLNKAVAPGGRVPLCGCCSQQIRGPFITALGRIWCPDHFVCVNGECRRQLADIGFVEEKGDLYCEYCFEKFIAPTCCKCNGKIKGDCLNAIGKHFHPECFTCAYCGKLFGNSPFFLEDGQPYCEADWNEMFTTKCFACGFPVEAGDRWVEALSHNYHSQCFNCTHCKTNLEGKSFFAKNGRPFCKAHAR